MIKLNCEETFNYICKNESNPDRFKDKLNIILIHIHDYQKIYNSQDKINKIDINGSSIYSQRDELNKNNITKMDNNYSRNGLNLFNNNNYKYNNNRFPNNNKINTFRSIISNEKDIKLKNYDQFGGNIDRYNYKFYH